jgi:hypothetical protein
MIAMYGHSWSSSMGEAPQTDVGQLTMVGDTWARGLTGLNDVQIASGLSACLMTSDEWPPSLPKFRSMCFGLPSFATVRAELHDRDAQRSSFARLVWSYVDAHRYRIADADRADRMLREAFDEACAHIKRGGAMPSSPVGRIEAPKVPERRPANPETVRKCCADIEALLGSETT